MYTPKSFEQGLEILDYTENHFFENAQKKICELEIGQRNK